MPVGSRTCLERATQLLALRPLSEFELKAKLEEFYTAEDIVLAIDKLKTLGALNDRKLAEEISEKLSTKASSLQIKISLERRGLAQYWVESDTEAGVALRIAQKKMSEKSTPASISRYLASKGFSEEVIESTLPKLFEDL